MSDGPGGTDQPRAPEEGHNDQRRPHVAAQADRMNAEEITDREQHYKPGWNEDYDARDA
jgi:hypothetical protein